MFLYPSIGLYGTVNLRQAANSLEMSYNLSAELYWYLAYHKISASTTRL
jgi:hypothetical protein